MKRYLRFLILFLLLSLVLACSTAEPTGSNKELYMAVYSGSVQDVTGLLAAGANVNARGTDGVTPLYLAVKFDRADLIEPLIARGAEVNARTKSGFTPLLWAAHTGNKDIAQLLIAHGADVNAPDVHGDAPLFWALNTAYAASPVGQKSTALQGKLSASEQQEFQNELLKLKGQWREVAMLLIDHNADVKHATKKGTDVPLEIAANLGYKDVVEALIARGLNVNGSSGETESPLHGAIAEHYNDVAELLILKGANVNARNLSQRTPLHFVAFYTDDRKLAELIIKHGADVNAVDKYGDTPLTFATKAGNNQVAEVLRQHGGK